MKMYRNSKPVKSKCTEQEFAAVAAKDTHAYRSHYKRQPMSMVSKYMMIGGRPHKLVDGVFKPLTSVSSSVLNS